MTVTFDTDTYSNLLSKYLPRIFQTEEANDIFLDIVEKLISRGNLNPE